MNIPIQTFFGCLWDVNSQGYMGRLTMFQHNDLRNTHSATAWATQLLAALHEVTHCGGLSGGPILGTCAGWCTPRISWVVTDTYVWKKVWTLLHRTRTYMEEGVTICICKIKILYIYIYIIRTVKPPMCLLMILWIEWCYAIPHGTVLSQDLHGSGSVARAVVQVLGISSGPVARADPGAVETEEALRRFQPILLAAWRHDR